MALQKCGLNLDRSRKEMQPHGTIDFPCAAYSKQYSKKIEDIIPWHWHDELEIVYIKKGTMKFQIPSNTYYLNEGDCIVINCSIPHYAIAAPKCELQSLVFSTSFITGTETTAFAYKYITPLKSCPSFSAYLIKDNENIVNNFINAFEALANDITGFEFIVRNHLSCICLYLYQSFEKEIVKGELTLNEDDVRIRKMLEYIHSNFSNDISLQDIAKASDIGTRECLRCFKRTIQVSPMQYLLKYRILQSADLLIKNPTKNISEISGLCGFDSPSNFAKMFKRYYNCTPREYRHREIYADKSFLTE